MRKTKNEIEIEMVLYQVREGNNKWTGHRTCPVCKNKIEHTSHKKYYLLRNIRLLLNKPCVSCNKIGDKNHFFKKTHTLKTKKLQSENRKNKACGKNNAMAKKENREKVSEALIKKYKSGDLDFLKKIQSENAKKNQGLGKLNSAPISKAEIEIKEILENRGFTIISQFNIKSLRYDLFLKEKNLLIEYNGDYWHCNPIKYNKDYINKKKSMTAKEIWKHDKEKKKLAIENNFNYIVIWENDYKKDKKTEIDKIINI